ncbi:glycoside hydrolase family 97 protein [Mucilaginibacter terrae]|uniref:glycoside hydrolase family 97 protein n=1 Tax=Mucilaginibacter terrae TaxID=1955052 RepID=UPI003633E96D
MKIKYILVVLAILTGLVKQLKAQVLQVKSPDGLVEVTLQVGDRITWSVKHQNTVVIAPSAMALTLNTGEILGRSAKVTQVKTTKVNTTFNTSFYKRQVVTDNYNQLSVTCKGNYGMLVRVYNDGAAYRFFLKRKGEVVISNEEASFNFNNDYKAYIPYIRDLRNNDKYMVPFESLYEVGRLSQIKTDTLTFLPQLIEVGEGKKAVILEADLENYPGMFLMKSKNTPNALQAAFAPYPLKEEPGGFNNYNYVVRKRANYIARINGTRSLPWRAVVISTQDKELIDNDMVQKLSAPSRIANSSWIKPGKVAWDWWNNWNVTKVDFEAGVNTPTYKYYIDFAAANKLEYIIMDEGWSNSADMTKISPKINLKEIVDYGREKNVGIILWASLYALNQVMDQAFTQYAEMGIKGFKIDFLDRDDQKMVQSVYNIAQSAANHHLLIDLHGIYKPTGVQRTYPNVINFEGVKGMENAKWTPNDDMPRYETTIPFIRMVAGPMDYTPGAMRNASKNNFRPSNSLPMSQGTRCHQLAMYIVYEAPLQMLYDNPTAYMKEQESTDFIASIPTVFDQTVALKSKIGEYAAVARKKDNTWYIGAISNWNDKMVTLDLSFLGSGTFEAELFQDGVNANRDPTDYKKQTIKITNTRAPFVISMAGGGGWAAKVKAVR